MLGEFLEKNCPDVSVKIVIKHTTEWNEFIDSVSFIFFITVFIFNRHAAPSGFMNVLALLFSPSREISLVMGPTSSSTCVTVTAKFWA